MRLLFAVCVRRFNKKLDRKLSAIRIALFIVWAEKLTMTARRQKLDKFTNGLVSHSGVKRIEGPFDKNF